MAILPTGLNSITLTADQLASAACILPTIPVISPNGSCPTSALAEMIISSSLHPQKIVVPPTGIIFTPISASIPVENISLWLQQIALRSTLKLAHRPKTTRRKRRESLMASSVNLSKSDTFSSQPQMPKMTHPVVSQVSSRIPTTA